MPENNIPTDLNELIDEESASNTLDKVIIQTGPEIIGNETENEEFIQTAVEGETDQPFQVDRVQQFIKCNWPQAEPIPINEFEYDGLCSLAFPSLFPNGLADPTKKARQIEVSETDGFKHLLKYATEHTTNQEMYYPFVKHPRFKFWSYDRLRRHRALEQSKIYLKQNIGKLTNLLYKNQI